LRFLALQQTHLAAFTANGAFTLAALAFLAVLSWNAAGRRTTFDALRLWELLGLIVLVFNVTSVPFNAVRHLLLFFMPAAWVAAAHLERTGGFPGGLRRGVMLASAFLGFALAAADYEIAVMYRTQVEKHLAPLARSGRNVWVVGNWGVLYYATQNGALPLVRKPGLYGLPDQKPGDLIFQPLLVTWQWLSINDRFGQQPREHIQPEAINWFRTIGPTINYYAVEKYALPWQLLMNRPQNPKEPAWYELPPLDDIVISTLLPRSRGPAGADGRQMPGVPPQGALPDSSHPKQ
ncbi:MAG: hypothetical protein ACRDD1_02735, partial [Planctomycetia bacterium]